MGTGTAWVATRKGVFQIGRSSGKWGIVGAHFLGDNCSMVLPDGRDGGVYAALGHGHFGVKMQRSRDGGKTWAECATPKYPPKPEDVAPVMDMWGKEIPWTLDVVWELAAGGADEPGVLWAGTVPGGVFKSTDGGDSWKLIESLWMREERRKWMGGGMNLPGVHSVCVHPKDSKRVAIGVSTGGVWETGDGGETWALHGKGLRADYMPPEQQYDPLAQDAHRLAQCAADPDVMWVQHHNGMFHSTDGGKTFEDLGEVKPSKFGFAVVAHPHEAGTAWFVPAIKDERRIPVGGNVVVTRTRDGGRTFDVLTKGLPQGHAYDIVYRHALDVDSSGTKLVMGSTTGALWVSEDQGDSWEAVSEHLPPVYAVRWG